MIDLIPVCQGYPGCPPGFPLVGVVAPSDAECVAYRLPAMTVEACIELGDIVPLGRLYTYPGLFVGEVVALNFEEASD